MSLFRDWIDWLGGLPVRVRPSERREPIHGEPWIRLAETTSPVWIMMLLQVRRANR